MPDHFTPVASQYAEFRPGYPVELFDWLTAATPQHDLAWDCGAGSGQATLNLAKRFRNVVATDISAAQLSSAPALVNVEYRVVPAELSALPDHSVDLVTVAQAMHWFDLPKFHAEVGRVLKPNGVIAVWGYNRLIIGNPAIQNLIDYFYGTTIDPYWPPERVHVENGYRDLAFPYTRIPVPPFSLEMMWRREHLLGYLRSWSAVARFKTANGYDPVTPLSEEVAKVWPEDFELKVEWPLFMHAGKSG